MAVYVCDQCNEVHHFPLSCGNRHCPTCQHLKTIQWNERAKNNNLPTHNFLATFTVPESIRNFIRSHQKDAYDALFKSSSDAIKKLVSDSKRINGDTPGFFGVLHTWGRQMQYHPHIHYVISGGAISTKDNRWHPSAENFFLPIKPLSIIFKAKFKEMMKEKGLLNDIPADVWEIDWNVNIQPSKGEDAIGYLSQYVFKVAISDHRISKVEDGNVTIRYSKPRSNRVRHLTLTAHEFIRRFLQHVLPKGFMKVRYYGFMHPCSSYSKTVRSLIELSIEFDVEDAETNNEIKSVDPKVCPTCGGKLILLLICF
ncbi:MAG: transposase [Candidatus Magnetoglobus multicellularis str. Araruama]|uniref:Transposase n=1 Tax=Candidatus Magnetoglobus multicellularis str. Araruama TaxID=890399 RepID=A0A1V1NVD8_9BACT|nr:MAG: transposase [Candidatus Magnetoglobus multicellularis str. Araruama]